MKTNRLNWEYRKNASKLHRAVGEALRAEGSLFANYKIYQEYPVDRINTSYGSSAHKFDWVVLDLALVIEAHGKQHFVSTSFGGKEDFQKMTLVGQQIRDRAKMSAAVEAGYTYVMVPYTDEKIVDPAYLWSKFREAFNPEKIQKKEKKEKTQYDKDRLEIAKQYRRKQYLKKKEFLAKLKGG